MPDPDPLGVHEKILTAATTIQAKTENLQDRLANVEDSLAAHLTIHPWFYSSITQGVYTQRIDTNYYRDLLLFNEPPADGDQINYSALMKAGTYSLKLIHAKGAAFGIWKLLIDDVEKATIDGYKSSTGYNYVTIVSDIVISTTSIKEISLKVDGKNASSSDYYMNISRILFQKTA